MSCNERSKNGLHQKQDGKNQEAGEAEIPSIEYPGDDPTVSPGEGWEWRGPKDKGAWYNPKTGEKLHPDLNHSLPVGPHWDYIPHKNGPQYRVMPDGTVVQKWEEYAWIKTIGD